jgi:hypothetical protein
MLGAILCPMIFATAVSAATYYVSPLGSDRNPGTSEEQPFLMAQRAVDQMKAGDTLVVLDGVYTGTLKLKSDITIKGKNPRKAIFSGAEPLTGTFQKHAGNIYKIKIGEVDPKQLFYKNEPMSWARWPNMKWSENWDGSKKWVNASAERGELTTGAFKSIKGLDLSGGYCYLRHGKGNSCFSRPIESFDGKTLHWNDDLFYGVNFAGEDGKVSKKGKVKTTLKAKFFLAGALDLLDSEGEWCVKDGVLYFYAPGGRQPNAADVLIKTNDYSFYETQALSNVTIEGIDFFATSIRMVNPENKKIIFRDDYFTYIGAEPIFFNIPEGNKIAKPIQVSGTLVGFDHCLIAGGHNGGLKLVGSKLIVRNCVFAENNRHANFQSNALAISPKGPFLVRHNTFFNNSSDAVRFRFHEDYQGTIKPDVSYNNICNAGLYNSDVSGVYMPNLSQYWTEFHHNWVHNVNGNGVRLDQAGEKLSVHHNVFWASKRGLNIEGFGNFNVYNNTSVLNEEAGKMTRNVVDKKKGTGDAVVSNDTSFSPITDWNVLNNLVTHFVDVPGPSEDGPYAESKKNGKLHPARAKSKTIPMTDRGAVQGNLMNFKNSIFKNGTLGGLNLIPTDSVVKGGVVSTPALKAENVLALDSFRGAYDVGDAGWAVGSDWMPYGIAVPETMAQSEALAKKYRSVSLVPEVNVSNLPRGVLGLHSYVVEEPANEAASSGDKSSKKKKSKNR